MKYLDSQKLQISSKFIPKAEPIFFYAEEAISQPFRFFVILTVTDDKPLEMIKLLRTAVQVKLLIAGKERFFNGSVRVVEELSIHQINQGAFLDGTDISLDSTSWGFKKDHFLYGSLFYRLELVPDFWFLGETQDCRIFQNMTIVGIIKKILEENALKFSDQINDTAKKQKEFCVQYSESALNFIRRLLDQEGYFYFFDHSENLCQLILSNKPPISIGEIGFKHLIMGDKPHLHMYEILRSESSVNESIVLADFDFEKPDQSLLIKKENPDHPRKQELVFSYPGGFKTLSEGQALADLHLKAQESKKHRITAQTTHPLLAPWKKFRLKDHPSAALQGIDFSILKVCHIWSRQGVYFNNAVLLPSTQTYISGITLSKPKIGGIQTAIVTGKASEEIWTEKYGRIKVKFHWDTRQESDENSSCWIRVASPLAGNEWGAIMTPRLGQEVIVVFVNGNPDEPIVIGSLYNGLHNPPYIAKEPAKTTFKTRTLKGKEGSEVTFDDTQDKEEIFIKAQRNYRTIVQNSAEFNVMTGSLKQIISRGDRSITLNGDAEPSEGKGDDHLVLTRGSQIIELKGKGDNPGNITTTLDKGNLATTLKKGDHTLLIQEGQATTTLTKGNYSVILDKGNSALTLKNGKRIVTVGGDDSLSVTQGNLSIQVAKGSISIKAGTNAVLVSEASLELKAKKITVAADALLELKAGVIKIKSEGMLEASATGIAAIKGAIVKLN